MASMTFAEAVDTYRAGDAPLDALYRAIASHPTWHVAGAIASGRVAVDLLRRDDGATFVEAFSNSAALATFVERERDAPARLAILPGHTLFASLPMGEIDRLNLDLHSPHATHFYRSDLVGLAQWAEALTVETALAQPQRFGDAMRVVAAFERFWVVERAGGGHTDLVLAPDPRGRELAAVFTAPDLVNVFAEQAAEELGGSLSCRCVAGAELFPRLAPMRLDGVVFNPLTALAPIALAAPAIDHLARLAAGHAA